MQRVISQCSQIASHTPYDLPYHIQPFFLESDQVHTPIKTQNRDHLKKVIKVFIILWMNDDMEYGCNMWYDMSKLTGDISVTPLPVFFIFKADQPK